MTSAATTGGFITVFGRGLVEELPNFVQRPYLVVTMEDLWPRFAPLLEEHLAGVHLVKTLDLAELERMAQELPECRSIIGLGGGQAIDVAKFFAWTRRLPLFQVPTSMTVNAPFGHRSGLRTEGKVRYLGWAVPEGGLRRLRGDPERARGHQPRRHRRHPVLPHRSFRLEAGERPWQGRAEVAVRRGAGGTGPPAARQRAREPGRDPRRHRAGHPDGDARAPLGRHHLPRLGLEPAPHRGHGALPSTTTSNG